MDVSCSKGFGRPGISYSPYRSHKKPIVDTILHPGLKMSRGEAMDYTDFGVGKLTALVVLLLEHGQTDTLTDTLPWHYPRYVHNR